MHVRLVATVLALCAILSAWYSAATPSPTSVPSAPVEASEPVAWTPEDFPIRVSTIEGGVRVEIAGYVDFECLGCTDEFAVQEAQRIMSKAVAESLPVGEGLDVGEPTMPAYVPAILLEAGWTGVQGDGCECLYPPNFTRGIAS